MRLTGVWPELELENNIHLTTKYYFVAMASGDDFVKLRTLTNHECCDKSNNELASILWDEAPDTVVPYHEGNEGSHSVAANKEFIKQLSSKEAETNRVTDKSDGVHGWSNESNLGCYSDAEKSLLCSGADPCKDPKLSTNVKQSPDSIGANLLNSEGKTQILYSLEDKETQVDKDSESSQKQLEGHGNGDFVDYSWDDIGGFDELDKIFGNDDPVFENVGLDGVDELWSCSIDAGYSLDKPFPSPVESLIACPESLDIAHMQNKIRTEHIHQSNHHLSDHDSLTDSMCYNRSNTVVLTETGTNSKLLETRLDRTEKGTVLSSPNSSCSTLNKLSNKVNKQKNNRKAPDHKMKGKSYAGHYLSENQLQQFGKQQDATSMVHSYPFSEQTQQNTSQHQSSKLAAPYENMYNQHSVVPIMPPHLCAMGSFQQNHEVSHGSPRLKSMHTPLKPLFMTPQEKIDKLRRRQQIQAILAIKKQQQELGHETAVLDIDGTEKNIEETPISHPYSGPGCSSPKEIACKVSNDVNMFPAENSALSQLQDIIAKLDSQVRLCIRDSLFRLATTAAQRHYPCDDRSANYNSRDVDYKLPKDEISNHNRTAPMVDAETETNPIDRTVAHLLFHRPFDSVTTQSENPNSSISTQTLPEAKTEPLVDLTTEYLKDNTNVKHSFLSQKESESSFPEPEPQLGSEFLDSSFMDLSDKTSSHEPRTEEP